MSIRPSMPLVLSVDENSQIQALDRTQPRPPMKRGRYRTNQRFSRPGRRIPPPLASGG
jgi:hypothetical protein